jgi:hypothetical protein
MAAPATRHIVLRAPEGEVDWTLIELQGAIEPRNSTQSLDGVNIGTLVRDDDGVPKIVMGRTQLEGSVVKLKKPLAIMSLVKPSDGSTEYHAAGVVRQKFVFKARSVPVPVTKPADLSGPSMCGAKRTRADAAVPTACD